MFVAVENRESTWLRKGVKLTSASEMWLKPIECFAIEEREGFFAENYAEVPNPQSSFRIMLHVGIIMKHHGG